MKPYYQKSGITLYNADCREVAKFVKCDFILSDVPYPDYYADEYGYFPPMFLNDFSCRQLIFWSAKVDFPLSHTAVHIWDKKSSAGSSYERIFERNGNDAYLIFRYGSIHNSVRAQFESDVFYGHKSQKPVRLMRELITKFVPVGAVIFDPFSGSGSTLAAARDLGYEAVGCEVSEKWCGVTVERLAQQSLFTLPNNRLHLDVGDSPAQQALFTPEADTAEGKLPAPAPRR
jgi:site-specific DNA-methyltransferase (adenine-specific)